MLVLAVIALLAALLVPASRPMPEWISGCSAWTWGADSRGFTAYCSNGSNRYFSRATCHRPKVGTYTRYGDHVWPGTRSDGLCAHGYLASNPGWTQ